MAFNDEKRADYIDKEKSSSINEVYDEAFIEPPPEETLHRGLKARQISMIAVSYGHPECCCILTTSL